MAVDATGLPGGYVAQQVRWDTVNGDCFSACVSMLTGIDLDLLPIHPPQMQMSWFDESGSRWYHVNRFGHRWEDWQELLADNGFKMEFVEDATTYIATAWNPGTEGHAVVVHNGIVFNPAYDERIKVDEIGWIIPFKVTVTPL